MCPGLPNSRVSGIAKLFHLVLPIRSYRLRFTKLNIVIRFLKTKIILIFHFYTYLCI